MIVIYGEDRIYFATSARSVKINAKKASEVEELEFWRAGDMLIQIDTECERARDLIRYLVKPPSTLDKSSLLDYCERIRNTLEDNFFGANDEGKYPFFIRIADDKNLYEVNSLGSVMHNNTEGRSSREIYATTRARDSAIVSAMPKGLSYKDKIKHYYERLEEITNVKKFPIVVFNTKDDEIEFIGERS